MPSIAAVVALHTLGLFLKFEFELEDEVAILLFAHQPGAPRVTALEHAALDFPDNAVFGRLADIIPAAHDPAFGDAVLGKEGGIIVCGIKRPSLR